MNLTLVVCYSPSDNSSPSDREISINSFDKNICSLNYICYKQIKVFANAIRAMVIHTNSKWVCVKMEDSRFVYYFTAIRCSTYVELIMIWLFLCTLFQLSFLLALDSSQFVRCSPSFRCWRAPNIFAIPPGT